MVEIGPHIFGDNRMGLWIITPGNLSGRLDNIKKLPGPITDLFLPETADVTHKTLARGKGFFVALWTAPHGRDPVTYANQSMAALDRLGLGALELNIEEPDAILKGYIEKAVATIRKKKPNLRLRINLAPFKAGFLPIPQIVSDPNLFVIMQSYFGNMDGRASESDILMHMLEWGVPLNKASVMYAAASEDPMDKSVPAYKRVVALPAMNVRRLRRGSIYQDDLLANMGLI